MTAVEWFNQQLVDRQNGNGDSRSRDEIFEQAKEMENEQKIELLKSLVYSVCIGDDVEDVEEWLKEHETFKSE
jgi:hypothetical protein